MTKPKNKIFAIIQMTMTDPTTGRTGPHYLGGIFDIDAQGRAVDCTAVDFEGSTIRKWPYNNFGKAVKLNVSHIPAEKALFFPITENSADLIKEAMAALKDVVSCGQNPFYRAAHPYTMLHEFEQHTRTPVTFDGSPKPLTQAERLEPRPSNYCRARAATNCRQFLQDVLRCVGGIPIDDLQLDGLRMPRHNDTVLGTDFLTELAGNRGKIAQNKNVGRLIHMGEGRYAYAYDGGTNWITNELNTLPKQRTADGREVTLAKFLTEESAPFYDPTLNEHDLGRRASGAQAR